MSMFGRRQTDEVFSTLQQVQRRLSHNTESGDRAKPRPASPTYAGANVRAAPDEPGAANPNRASADRLAAPVPAPAVPIKPLSAPSIPATTPDGDESGDEREAPPALSFRPTGTSIPEPIPDEVFAGRRQRGIRVGTEAIATLVVVWILTVVGAYLLGNRNAAPKDAGTAPGETPAYRSTDERTEGGGVGGGETLRPQDEQELLGNDVMVLMSVSRMTEQAEREFQDWADFFNAEVQKPAAKKLGHKPWFGVRAPKSGGLQLVFGLVDGKFGINRFSWLAKLVEDDFKKSDKFDTMWLGLPSDDR